MDRLFRRFELNLGDLASLRDLPELRSQVDRLKPGELLRLMHRGGELVFQFSDGAQTAIKFTALDGALFRRGSLGIVDVICTTEWNGRTGFCNAEISTNPRLGSAPIKVALNANMEDGFSSRSMRPGMMK